MKKIVLLLILGALVAPFTFQKSEASLISDRSYRAEINKENRQELKQVKNLFKIHETYANNHDIKGLGSLYSDKYMNSDGFGKEVYFKSIKDTWDSCKDLTYQTKIISTNISGDYASVSVEETANGTITDIWIQIRLQENYIQSQQEFITLKKLMINGLLLAKQL